MTYATVVGACGPVASHTSPAVEPRSQLDPEPCR